MLLIHPSKGFKSHRRTSGREHKSACHVAIETGFRTVQFCRGFHIGAYIGNAFHHKLQNSSKVLIMKSFAAPSNERIRDLSGFHLASEKCHVIVRVTYPSPSLSLIVVWSIVDHNDRMFRQIWKQLFLEPLNRMHAIHFVVAFVGFHFKTKNKGCSRNKAVS